jgi:hypothetical protein
VNKATKKQIKRRMQETYDVIQATPEIGRQRTK